MAQKRFLSWLGFNEGTPDQDSAQSIHYAGDSGAGTQSAQKSSAHRGAPSTRASEGSESSSPVARIRELEAELADLRSRRDLTSLTKEEFEILATETAVSLVRTAQARESRALAAAQKMVQDSTRSAQSTIQSAEETARQVLATADQRSKRTLAQADETAKKLAHETESAAAQRIEEARRDAEGIISAKKKEATNLIANARKSAEDLVTDASQEVAHFKNWLASTLTESERLYRTQLNSLNGAQTAIEEAKNRLTQSFTALRTMHANVLESADLTRSAANAPSKSDASDSAAPVAVHAKTVSPRKTQANSAKKKKTPSSTSTKAARSKSGTTRGSSAKKSGEAKSLARKKSPSTTARAKKSNSTKKSSTKR